MRKKKNSADEFTMQIVEAVKKLRDNEFEESYKLIVKTISENPNAPEPHNLLGIWHEINQETEVALKHYRAAYALDPTYKPACMNIERLCIMAPYRDISYDFGIESK